MKCWKQKYRTKRWRKVWGKASRFWSMTSAGPAWAETCAMWSEKWPKQDPRQNPWNTHSWSSAQSLGRLPPSSPGINGHAPIGLEGTHWHPCSKTEEDRRTHTVWTPIFSWSQGDHTFHLSGQGCNPESRKDVPLQKWTSNRRMTCLPSVGPGRYSQRKTAPQLSYRPWGRSTRSAQATWSA